MTAQIDDLFPYKRKLYSIAGISEGELFDVSALGLQPISTCTACWRGYQAVRGLVTESHRGPEAGSWRDERELLEFIDRAFDRSYGAC